MTNDLQPGDLADRVVDLVQQFWNDHSRPLLLSQLGARDDGQIGKLAKEQAGSLGTYLRLHLSSRVRVLQHSTRPTVVGAVPAEEDILAGDSDRLLNQTQTPAERAAPRFHPAFWAAFRKPLGDSQRRYMNIQPPLYFRDESPDVHPTGFVEIERDYIADSDADDATVQQRINDWLAENEIDHSILSRDNKSKSARLPADDLLGRLLFALEPEELKRMSIPLDIVRKLRSQSA